MQMNQNVQAISDDGIEILRGANSHGEIAATS
jgi:hypothetical protein